MSEAQHPTPTYGLLAEFDTPEALIAGIDKVQGDGYDDLDAYTPFPIHDVCEKIAKQKSKVPLLVFFGGLTGATVGFCFQWWATAVSYPMNIGGRPLFSWPAFIPATFELLILFASFSAVFGMFMLNGLPRPHHPVFNVPQFERASTDRYFLLIKASDPRFEQSVTRAALEGLGSEGVYDVDW